jgi:hypothetical protein
MPTQHGIYYQPQIGGLCRLHSLNGYFGKETITRQQFDNYILEYDTKYKKLYNFTSSCESFDVVASDQKNIVSHILKKHNVYTKYYALNQIHGKYINEYIINILKGDWFFIYNESHIYGVRRLNNKWYIVDSMSGVRPININSINQKNIGFIVPVNIKDEFYRNIKLIKDILSENNQKEITKEIIKTHLEQKNKEKLILGELEIPLSICMDILDTNLIRTNNKNGKTNCFSEIQKYVNKYNIFLSQFTNGNYNNLQLVLTVTPILHALSSLNFN